ncbi:MAG TPA: SGNH/GDSL hydrolase family protein, partial [Flavobacteriaceae bacterium]|nr:SGNH/GDSL hydrolase family protein [Flavobacteriaceae bacterium]
PITYLALGDSYTIGEKVSENDRWPNQLAMELNKKGHRTAKPTIIAKTGWTTDDLLVAVESKLEPSEKYDLVSVLIGVNNQYQGKSISDYEKDLRILFQQAIDHAAQGKNGVFVLSIPDYGITPFGKAKGGNISKEIAKFNTVCEKVCQDFGIDFYNITPISKYAEMDSSLLAEDMLHPSGLMYTLWVSEILEKVEKKL